MMGKFEKLNMDEKMNPVFQTINSTNNEVVETLTPEQKGLWKSKEFYILFQRVALNPKTLMNISAWFAQKIMFKVPSKEEFDYHYFAWEKGFSVPCVRVLDSRMGRLAGFTFQVSATDATYTKKIGAAKRLSVEQVRKIVLEKSYDSVPFLGIYNERGEESVAAKRN
jgi:hypothetical protein